VAGIAAGVGPDFSGVAKGAKIIAVQVFSNVGGSARWDTVANDWFAAAPIWSRSRES
jgi:subtilisin family serine protease